MHTSTLRFAAIIGALTLVAAACGSSSKSSSSASAATPTTAASSPPATMMALPPFAATMKTTFSSPADNTKVTGNTLDVTVAATGYTLSCDWAGKAPKQGFGHYHLLLDKSLINMFCTPNASVSLQNVTPGAHVLEVVPALNDHAEVDNNAQSLHFDYQPTSPRPEITPSTATGTPSVAITSPQAGATVSGSFDVAVAIRNFTPSCALYGRPDLPGYGHWHLNWDSATGGMGGMATMAGMSCQSTLHASTVGLTPGPHKLIAILVGNSHAPFNPMVTDTVSVNVG